MNLYADENFPKPVVQALRTMRHDVVTIQQTSDAGLSIPDDMVLARATADGRAVLTINRRHFLRLHHEQPAHAGIIVCTFDPDFARQAARIDAAIAGSDSLSGQVLRVNRPDR